MTLTPRETDKLLVAMAAEVARRRLSRGVKLNHPEAVALTTDYVVEGVGEMIHDVQVEATFPDGAKRVTVQELIR